MRAPTRHHAKFTPRLAICLPFALATAIACNRQGDGEGLGGAFDAGTDGTSGSGGSNDSHDVDAGVTTIGGDESNDASSSGMGSDGDDDGPRFDVAAGTATDGDGADDGMVDEGCRKIDLLFVVDSSSSTDDIQGHLLQTFPGFVTAMQQRLGDVDSYHVGVVSGGYRGVDAAGDGYPYNHSACEGTLGALVTQTGGTHSSDAVCTPFTEGHRFMTEQDDLAQKFGCAAQLGILGGDNETPIRSLLAALKPSINGPGGCNEGFLRDDALLVVTIIIDQDDKFEPHSSGNGFFGSPGTPTEWFDEVVMRKGGVEESVVMVVVARDPSYNGTCADNSKHAPRLHDFAGRFTNSYWGEVCLPPYDAAFDLALDGIESACDDFVPPAG